jgi:predicted Zn-dependent peptidase
VADLTLDWRLTRLANGLRYPILGTLDSLNRLEHECLLAFCQQRYVAGNTLLTPCGDIEHAHAARLVAEEFAGLAPGPEQKPSVVHERPMQEPGTAHLEKDLHQTLLLMGVPAISMKHKDRSALKAMERLLLCGKRRALSALARGGPFRVQCQHSDCPV